ncbi:MAG: MmpS family transport accessory protein [Mycobacterium sp.]|jgi:hypothetical protein|uniref:MmpS family transport accessory protein n=1 Tax=Mycobacterium sp. TaxID=1785 RepID=UPI003899D7FD
MHRLVARRWMLLVAVLVVAVAGFRVSRLHGILRSNHNAHQADTNGLSASPTFVMSPGV